jgi:flagellar hook-associated protein 1 FlgK
MGSLFSTIQTAASSLNILSRGLQVTENNVGNANTPGYARQSLQLESLPFDPTVGLPGGVLSAGLESSRDPYAEQSVRTQQSALGLATQQSNDLQGVEPYFSLTGSNISSSLSQFFNSFSQLSISPNDATARQTVISDAGQLASSFQQTANGLASQASAVGQETSGTVANINSLASDIAKLTTQGAGIRTGTEDAGVDANLNSDLEQLSQYAQVTVLQQPNGSLNVYLNGRTPLVLGNQASAISVGASGGQTTILDGSGKDITSDFTTGQLAGELQTQNTTIPGYLTQLNALAKSVADQVNTTLAGGVDETGAAPAQNLFTYDATNANATAQSFAVTSITPSEIAAASAGAPGGNGNALAVAGLATAPLVGGATFTQAYGNLAANVGSDVSNAQASENTSQGLLTQAQSLRSQASGVSLDQEAANLLQLQSSYEATSKLINVVDQITETLINIFPAT